MLVRKTLRLQDVALKMDAAGGTFEGYASVFDGVDAYGDTIKPGAFADTLSANGMPKMFFNHQWDMPIGKWTTAKEDERGLFVKGELTDGLALAADVRAAMRHGTLDGLSIGGYLRAGDYEDTENGRVIRKWSSLVEVSPVVFPADASARVDLSSVKGVDIDAAINDIETVRQFERFLREAGGMSKAAAIALVARAKRIFSTGEPGTESASVEPDQIAERVRRLAEALR